jgi:hypothetical protein
MRQPEVLNAIIKEVQITIGDGPLTIWLFVDHTNGTQGFGGYALHLNKEFKHHSNTRDYTGHFIQRCLEIAGATEWKSLPGKTIRVLQESSKIHAIGHIIKEDWVQSI